MGMYSFSGSVVDITVKTTGVYDIIGYGAQGGQSEDIYGRYAPGGLGAEQGGLFNLTAGEQLEIVVGGAGQILQQHYANGGDNGPGMPTEAVRYGGGGGGTFVLVVNSDGSTTPLLVAGGGGGAKAQQTSYGGTTGAPGTGAGGATGPDFSGDGQSAKYSGGGGAGVLGNGSSSTDGGGGSNGSAGYYGGSSRGGVFQTSGGFGGGGGASPSYSGNPGVMGGHPGGAGGGGGYTGGAGGYSSAGQGGTSFVAASGTSMPTQTMAAENSGNGFVVFTPDVACYREGTLILTGRGAVPIEALAPGDRVMTASGVLRPVVWTGHRKLDTARHPDPRAVWPVQVSAGAFGENLPVRDVWLSPGHNLFVGGMLMPVRALINGVTVAQMPVDTVTYWHVELDSHDVVLAEGLPAESYLDTGNRTAFVNGGAFLDMHPDFEPLHENDTCAPIRKSGPDVEAARAVLLARAADLGYATTSASDLHIVADGHRIDPILLAPMRLAFTLPAGCTDVRLASRTFVPSHVDARRTDNRTLGLCVKRLQIDGTEVDISALPDTAWHKAEEKPSHVQRWTRGAVPLADGVRLVLVELAQDGLYRLERRDNVVALRA